MFQNKNQENKFLTKKTSLLWFFSIICKLSEGILPTFAMWSTQTYHPCFNHNLFFSTWAVSRARIFPGVLNFFPLHNIKVSFFFLPIFQVFPYYFTFSLSTPFYFLPLVLVQFHSSGFYHFQVIANVISIPPPFTKLLYPFCHHIFTFYVTFSYHLLCDSGQQRNGWPVFSHL